MSGRKQSWKILKLRISTAHPMNMDSDEFGIQLNVEVDGAPDRAIFRRITADEADRIADELHAKAAEARQRTGGRLAD
jgi:hypothetical protein